MKGATPEMEAEWSDEFAQCFVVAFMWADDQREAAAYDLILKAFSDAHSDMLAKRWADANQG